MFIADFFRALGQLGDPRFRRVLALGVGLSLLLLIGIYVAMVWLLHLFLGSATLSLPWMGEIATVANLASWASAFLMLGLSIFLMVPVASVFTGFFLDDVADAVEDKHYPHLPPARRLGLAENQRETLSFLCVVIAVNAVALVLYFFSGPFAPFIFIAVNGYLLGREYFTLAAMRRLERDKARSLSKRHMLELWIAGMLMALPLSIPIVNLLVPVLGAATFTHIFHRLNGK